MISTAFAFFYSNLKQNFTMHAAVWDIDIYVKDSNGTEIQSGYTYTCQRSLEEGEVYKFTLSPSGTATEGYCIIKITNLADETELYYTNSFKTDKTIKIRAVAGCEISFVPKWGKPDKYGITECYENIDHSHTEVQLTEEPTESGVNSETGGESSSSTEGSSTQSERLADTSSETLPKTDSTESSALNENSGKSPETSSSHNSANSESSSLAESSTTSSQSVGDSNSSTSAGGESSYPVSSAESPSTGGDTVE